MRMRWLLPTTAVCAAITLSTGIAAAEETAQETINRLQSEGYTVNIDRTGTLPMSQCVVTNVRNPNTVKQWVPYVGPGTDERVLVQQTVSQSISVSLDCNRSINGTR
ncbi:hypothetical protein H7J86_25560 [Mycobacterium hackensackense]|uniref:hypothetical protein n=1 Tax=Mycobacterium hackensackense TaxID=228909 RepID=UPI002265818D|nr:hypothetical protein [Mycobacterium hackensackense]MCV7255534.1 hypothetical protein [Mycobacterium hackensackense]